MGEVVRFATIRWGDETRAAVDFGTHFRLTHFGDLAEALRAFDGDVTQIAHALGDQRVDRDGANFAPAVTSPSKIICVGLNYGDHIREMGRSDPDAHIIPTLFAKYPDTLCGPFDDLKIPAVTNSLDWEVELGVVIGRGGFTIPLEDAERHIAGYVVSNDVSLRDLQSRTSQFLQGKMADSTTPVGPELVTPDEVNYGKGLRLRCLVDGKTMQESTTDLMLTPVAELITYVSSIIRLRPGDLLLTGTPSGVGAGRKPQVFLRPGQLLESEIEGLGVLRNRIVAS
jgi:acylpyruvate hydrolase